VHRVKISGDDRDGQRSPWRIVAGYHKRATPSDDKKKGGVADSPVEAQLRVLESLIACSLTQAQVVQNLRWVMEEAVLQVKRNQFAYE